MSSSSVHASPRLRRLATIVLSLATLSVAAWPGVALAAPGAPPRPVDDVITTLEDVPASGNVLANDDNLGDGTLSVTAYGALDPSIGTLTIDANGDYTFTPAADWTGTTTTTYDVANDKHTRTATITITVTGTQDPPTAVDDTVSVAEDTPTDVASAILANDTDPDGDTLSVTGISNETAGVAFGSGAVMVTPDADACGTGLASFDYAISDGNGGSAAAHVTVDVTCVDDAPLATDDSASGTEDTDLVVTSAELVANDTDIEGDSLDVAAVANATGGSVALDAGSVTFTPDADLCGAGAGGFDYDVSDGNGGLDTGHVTVDLTCVNDAPFAADDTVTLGEDDAATDVTSAILANDGDVDGDGVSVSGVTNATGGAVALDAGAVLFTPDADLCGAGAAGFDYEVADGNGGVDTAHVTVDLTCSNDDPGAVDDTVAGTEDEGLVIDGGDLTANDTDVDGDPLTVTSVDGVTGGTAGVDAGDVTFTPDANLCGVGAGGFDYTVSDGNGGTATGHVTVDLACVNDDPVAGDDTATLDEDVAGDLTATILANDADADGDPLAVSGVGNPTGGSVVLDGGTVTFTPDADVCGAGAGGFDYDLTDGEGGFDAGQVTVDITCVNDDPVAADDGASGTEDTDLVIDVAELAANDSDVDGDTLSVDGVSDATGGSVQLDAGSVTFTPQADLCGDGAAGFDYEVIDGNGGSATGHVTVDLGCVNDMPAAADDTVAVDEDTAADVTGAILANDDDVDGDDLAVTDASNATGGSADLDAGAVTFTPAPGTCGDAAGGFDYTVSDGNGGSDSAHATVDVTCVNDAPAATDDTANGTEDTDVVIAGGEMTANDTDADGDELAIDSLADPTGGTAALDSGTITFTPSADLCGDGAAGFDYVVADGHGGSDTGHVAIDLACVNDPPVAVDDLGGIVGVGSGAKDYDVLVNDTDAEDDPLTLEDASVAPASGTAAIVAGKVRFTPAAAFHGEAVVTYTVSDGSLTDEGTLTITVGADVTPPVPGAPTVAFAPGRVNETAALRIRWSAIDAGSGVASYEVQVSVNGGAYTPVYAGPGRSAVKPYPFNKSLRWRVRATDHDGNVSGWVTSATRAIASYQNGGTVVRYRGAWKQVVDRANSGSGYAWTIQKGARVRLGFTGRAVRYVAPKTPQAGHVRVYVDGVLLGRFNLRRDSIAYGRTIAKATWGSSAHHVIRVVNDQGGRRTNFDVFLVLK